eukprot:CAMPEP_0174242234 /NCGR_PEP_ID=MMETSP0417-20130205/26970_1 /TAXON_ID=242541 /ORGANISM="Mayorella sp, Strain BSH-02190019" /LENGTH=295 /DNA_ID=CAMNT_0015321599 /DNA_START=138 /DNA_END=1022 /DNA_ORIENTATION=+
MAIVLGGAVAIVAGIGVYKFALEPMWQKHSLRRAFLDHSKKSAAEFALFLSQHDEFKAALKAPKTEYRISDILLVLGETRESISSQQPELLNSLPTVLSLLLRIRMLGYSLKERAAEAYDRNNPEHEKKLLRLWSAFKPDTPLSARVCKDWGDLGFQGSDPATDFRGMGVLGLEMLLFLAETFPSEARAALLHSQHPTYYYPFAVAAINWTARLVEWVSSGVLDAHFLSLHEPTMDDFAHIFARVMFAFDAFYLASKPKDLMEFPRLFQEAQDALCVQAGQDSVEPLRPAQILHK